MKFRNIKIGTQLIFGFTIILLFVITVGIVAYLQTVELHQQTVTMYEHPLQVRRAIGTLNEDILNIYICQKDFLLADSDQKKLVHIQNKKLLVLDVEKQFDIILERYLGPRSNVEQAYQDYLLWLSITQESDNHLTSSMIAADSELESAYREKMFVSINIISEFSINKGNELFRASVQLHDKLKQQLLILILVIFLLSTLISYRLLRSIRKPLQQMNDAVRSFNEGDLGARSFYKSTNEFGLLSDSINNLATLVQENTILSKMASNLTDVMLSEEDAKKFFVATMGTLATHTEAQMIAVYLLNERRQTFDYFESIGMNHKAKPSFDANDFEGEFGSALFTRKIQYLQNIPENTRFEFNTISGAFIPREIITIPIVSGDQVIALISMATLSHFAGRSMEMIDSILVTMSARIQGILAFRKIKDYKDEVEKQNSELTAQKSELSAQTTELVQQNAELEIQKKQLGETSRLKTTFLSNMSHELRTPLNSVIALSGVLHRRLTNKIPDEEYSYLEIIERNGKNLLMLINDVLDISRIEAGREELEITKFDINQIIAEVVAMIQPQAKQKEVDLIHESLNHILWVGSDSDKCRHILQNLIGNAVKFTEKGKVVISAVINENGLEIKVADTGIGISIENQQHIFEEFRQADGSTSRRFGGTGLGLAIANKYARLLRGAIKVNSTLDVGSTFILALPLQYETDGKVLTESTTENDYLPIQQPLRPQVNSVNKTILLVEDNESAIIQIKDLVEAMGYEVKVAHDGVEAFRNIEKKIPDAMILDLMMPDIDGFEVLKLLRNAELTAHIPVLILTAKHITKEELKSLKRNNIHQLIQKGDVDRMKLQSAVTNMLFPAAVKQEPKQRDFQPIIGKPVVLVVEDNPDNMITVKALLMDDYTLIEAINGQEGIDKAVENVPHLILMDIALPGITGIDAFLKIRSMAALQQIPVIALTASALEHERENILAYGFDAFIAKPIIAEEFLLKIREVIYGK